MVMYDKSKSKIQIVCDIAKELPTGHGRKLCVSDIRQSQEWRCGNRAEFGEHPLLYHSPESGPRYARRRRECRGTLSGILPSGEFVSA